MSTIPEAVVNSLALHSQNQEDGDPRLEVKLEEKWMRMEEKMFDKELEMQ